MRGMTPRLPLSMLAACACVLLAPASAHSTGVDTWGTRRLSLHGQPHVLSHSDVNPSRPAAALPARQALLQRALGPHRLQVDAAASLGDWQRHGPILVPEAERALAWLAKLAPTDGRSRLLVLHLVDRRSRYTLRQVSPAVTQVRVDLLLPVDATPSSPSVALAQGLALALHEASHALRPPQARDRDDDEYRASLLAACYLVDGLQRGDRLRLQAPPPRPGDFSVQHSEAAREQAIADLAQAAGTHAVDGGDLPRKAAMLGFCQQRLARPAR